MFLKPEVREYTFYIISQISIIIVAPALARAT